MTATHPAWIAYKAVASELEALLARAAQLEPESRQKALLQVLNRLELAYLDLPDVEPDDQDSEAPDAHAAKLATVAAAFPEFGQYHFIRPSPIDEKETVGSGYAVDDLVDILRDIDDTLWTEARQGQTSAIWQAKFNYEHHSGAHLADLRSYLYRLRFFGP